MTHEEKEMIKKLKFHLELIYQNDGFDLAIATADGRLCFGTFRPESGEAIAEMQRVLDAYNTLPSLLEIIERQESALREVEQERDEYRLMAGKAAEREVKKKWSKMNMGGISALREIGGQG